MNAPLRVGSLFAGIGGWDLGLERTGGFETAWFCEQDDFCRRVLAKHWPGLPCFPDIQNLHGRRDGSVVYVDPDTGVRYIGGPVDVLCGGFPCQDISVAGKGEGLSGARSGLWFEYLRLIRELRPRYVLVENVPALRTRGLHVVLQGLAESGFDAEWDGIPASAVGAHHQRDRLWLVAYPQRVELRDESRGRSGSHGEGSALASVNGSERAMGDADGARLQGHRGPELRADQGPAPETGVARVAAREGKPQSGMGLLANGLSAALARPRWIEPNIPRVAEGVPNRAARLKALGNANVPQIAEWIGSRILAHESSMEAFLNHSTAQWGELEHAA